ncbi:hypothetical protein J6590_020422 [Homalodisca vitripennis]|nr:hypothetical protein J6590_020422 [Homalodisca vitripennis]
MVRAPSHSLDSTQSSPYSDLQHYLYNLVFNMDYINKHSEAWLHNYTYGILTAVGCFLILVIACSCYCYRQHSKRVAARRAQTQARVFYHKFGPRPITIEMDSQEQHELEAVNEVPRGLHMRDVDLS